MKSIKTLVTTGMLIAFTTGTGYAAQPSASQAPYESMSASSASTASQAAVAVMAAAPALVATAHPKIVTAADQAASQFLMALTKEACINMREYCKKHVQNFNESYLDRSQQFFVLNTPEGRDGCFGMVPVGAATVPTVQMDEKYWHDLFRQCNHSYGAQRFAMHHEMAHAAFNNGLPYYTNGDQQITPPETGPNAFYINKQDQERFADMFAARAGKCYRCTLDAAQYFMDKAPPLLAAELTYFAQWDNQQLQQLIEGEAKKAAGKQITHPNSLERSLYLLYEAKLQAENIKTLCQHHQQEQAEQKNIAADCKQITEIIDQLIHTIVAKVYRIKQLTLLETEENILEIIEQQIDVYRAQAEVVTYAAEKPAPRVIVLGDELIPALEKLCNELTALEQRIDARRNSPVYKIAEAVAARPRSKSV